MSVLNKIPYISALLNSLTAEQLQTLTNLMNGSGDRTPLRRTVNPNADSSCPHIASGDKGVHMCALTYNYTVFNGYLVYSDDYCALISYTDSTVLKVFDIDVSNVGISTIDEAITVLELRTVVWELMNAGGGSGGGTDVVANPTLVGTESELTSLEVGSTKYKVAGNTPKVYSIDLIPNLTYAIGSKLKVGDVVIETNYGRAYLVTVVDNTNVYLISITGDGYTQAAMLREYHFYLNNVAQTFYQDLDYGYDGIKDIEILQRDFFELSVKIINSSHEYIQVTNRCFENSDVFYGAVSSMLSQIVGQPISVENSDNFNTVVQGIFTLNPSGIVSLACVLGTFDSYNKTGAVVEEYHTNDAEPSVFNVLPAGILGEGAIVKVTGNVNLANSIGTLFGDGTGITVEGRVTRNGMTE